jgi:hypothetical protein
MNLSFWEGVFDGTGCFAAITDPSCLLEALLA